jgi:radical SAM protein with 4Fe4S-binding SPASM domain
MSKVMIAKNKPSNGMRCFWGIHWREGDGFGDILRRNLSYRFYRTDKVLVTKQDVIGSSRPRDFGFESTNICNAKCSFCGYGKINENLEGDPRKKKKLSEETYRHGLELFSNAGGGVLALSPILGEVSVDPKWLENVALARSFSNITGVSCFTNGILLHKFGYENILTSGITDMNISTALGSREQYLRLYGKDEYDQVLANIIGMAETNKALGKPVRLTLLLRIDKPFSTFLSSETYQKLCDFLGSDHIRILEDDWDDFRGLVDETDLPKGHVFKSHADDKTEPCYALFRKLQVMVDGTIQGCSCRVEPDLWCGNINDYSTLEDAWQDPGLERIRAEWFAGKLPKCCESCSHYYPYTSLLKRARVSTMMNAALKKLKSYFFSTPDYHRPEQRTK